ncbi:MAG: hypothetical protein M3176_18580 [Chloroflexota bacterium]|nr:hypothetical protein [Chloroflexota bacterium]
MRDRDTDLVVGFYTLSTTSVDFSAIPEQFSADLPRYPVPAVLLGRMGVDRRYERQGFGKRLVTDALFRVYYQDLMAVFGMVVDPKEGVRDFYTQNFDFVPLADGSSRLFLHLQSFMGGLAAPVLP